MGAGGQGKGSLGSSERWKPPPPSRSRIGPGALCRPGDADVGAPPAAPGAPAAWGKPARSRCPPQPSLPSLLQGTPELRYRQGQVSNPPRQRVSSRATSTNEHDASGR